MGNACSKKATRTAAVQNKNLNQFELDQLLHRKAELEIELAKWRESNHHEIQSLRSEIESAKLGTSSGNKDMQGDANLDPIEAAKSEISQFIDKEIKLIEVTCETLANEANDNQDQSQTYDELNEALNSATAEINSFIKTINSESQNINSEEIDETTKQIKLFPIAEYYRPISNPKNVTEFIKQLKIDYANCSAQTVKNIRALIHHLRTGDDSKYVKKPIRTMATRALHIGNKPHEHWNCDLCNTIDFNDAPLLI